jgi:hypothetical protein
VPENVLHAEKTDQVYPGAEAALPVLIELARISEFLYPAVFP